MLSRITIEVDFDNNNLPVIQVISKDSDDVRDKLLKAFLQSLQHTSRWCIITYEGTFNPDSVTSQFERWKISPMTPSQMQEEMKLLQAAIVTPDNRG